ncbi:Protein ALP1-like [Linum perenne]
MDAVDGFQTPNTPSMMNPPTPSKKHPKQSVPKLLPILSAAATAAQGFISANAAVLLPHQILSLQRLLDSLPLQIPFLPSPSIYNLLNPPSSCNSTAASDYLDPLWFQLFRMKKPTFLKLLGLLGPSLQSKLPPSLPPDVALAAALYRLSYGSPFATVARWFGLDSPEAARVAFYAVCQNVCQNMSMFVEFWNDIESIRLEFRWLSLPNCCGVLGFHRFGFVNKDELGTESSYLVQALVDSSGKFLDISTGWPGNMSPDSILKESKFFSNVKDTNELRDVPEHDSARRYIVGDPSLPLLPWLLTPFNIIDEEVTHLGEKQFNLLHRRAMELHNSAFSQLKARWQLLGKKWRDDDVELLPFVIVMGCVLHNFLVKVKESLPEEFTDHGSENAEVFPVYKGDSDDKGRRIRDKLADHLGKKAYMGRISGKGTA